MIVANLSGGRDSTARDSKGKESAICYTRENQKGDFRVASIFTEPFGDKKFTHIVGNYPFSIKGDGAEMTSKYDMDREAFRKQIIPFYEAQ